MNRVDQHAVGKGGNVRAQGVAHRRLALHLRAEERDLHASVFVGGEPVELDAGTKVPDVDWKSGGCERCGAAARLEPVQLLRFDLERQPVDLE